MVRTTENPETIRIICRHLDAQDLVAILELDAEEIIEAFPEEFKDNLDQILEMAGLGSGDEELEENDCAGV